MIRELVLHSDWISDCDLGMLYTTQFTILVRWALEKCLAWLKNLKRWNKVGSHLNDFLLEDSAFREGDKHIYTGILVSLVEISGDIWDMFLVIIWTFYTSLNSFLASLATNASLDGREDLDFFSRDCTQHSLGEPLERNLIVFSCFAEPLNFCNNPTACCRDAIPAPNNSKPLPTKIM